MLQGYSAELSSVDPSIAVHLEIDAKYDVYLKRQHADVDAFRAMRDWFSPTSIMLTCELLSEARSKLEEVGQAGRLDGLTPAALGIWRPICGAEPGARRRRRALKICFT